MVDWPEALVEDYLNLVDNLIALANAIDNPNTLLQNVERVTPADSPYTVKATDQVVFFDTDDGDILAGLSAGVEGQTFRLVNVGSSGNIVTVAPVTGELIYGDTTEYIADQEALIVTFNPDEGWN